MQLIIGFFFAATVYSTVEANKAGVRTIKQSIFLDVYDASLFCSAVSDECKKVLCHRHHDEKMFVLVEYMTRLEIEIDIIGREHLLRGRLGTVDFFIKTAFYV